MFLKYITVIVILFVANNVVTGNETAANLVANPSFESLDKNGMPVRWKAENNPKVISVDKKTAWNGANSMHFKLDGKLTRFIQDKSFSIIPGKVYTLSAVIKTKGLSVKSKYGVMLVNDGWAWASPPLKIDASVPGWKRYAVSFKVPELKGKSKKVRINMYWDGDAGDVWVDALQLEEGKSLTQYRESGIEPARVSRPPVLDGKLNDPCWKLAAPITGFFKHSSSQLAENRTTARILYDDNNLYIGIKCFDSHPENIIAKTVSHDGAVWSHDMVEIMLDSSGDRSNYIHLAVNAAGATYDSLCSEGGAKQDPRWNGKWRAKTSRDTDGWSVEIAVPFGNMNIKPGASRWAINICREKPQPKELSSIIPSADFHSAEKFIVLKRPEVNFDRFHYSISPALVSFDIIDNKPHARIQIAVKNETGKTRNIKIKPLVANPGKDNITAEVMTLKSGESSKMNVGHVRLEEMISGKPGKYMVSGEPNVREIVISDPETGNILAGSTILLPRMCTVMAIKTDNPVSPDKISSKADKIKADIKMLLTQQDSEKSILTVRLRDHKNKIVDSREIRAPEAINQVVFSTKTLPWGSYSLQAVYKRGDETLLACTKPYALMPDGIEKIKVLNNMVFELLNAESSGRLQSEKFVFMNPRKGWVFFSLKAGKEVKLFLDAKNEPLLVGKGERTNAESMQLLSAGRHQIRFESPKNDMKQLIARAIPELIYTRLAFGPRTKEFGPYDWEFLWRDVLPNCTTILGHPRGKYTDSWAALGRSLVDEGAGHVNMPQGSDCTTKDFLAVWEKNAGLADAKYSGIFLDEFGGSGFSILGPLMKAMRQVAANPKYKGKRLVPWSYFIPGKRSDFNHGSAASTMMAETVFRAGWPVAYEAYLLEAPAGAEQKGIDLALLDPIRYWNRAFPGAVQQMILCLNYSSREFNINPGVDFKVHMDMQFHAVANNPEFFGLYGITEYISSWADREHIRWAGRLYRHYCIEGNRERLSKDPYVLAHVENPDFAAGLSNWHIQSAEPGSIAAKTIPEYGSFQRYNKLFTAGWQAARFPAGWKSLGDHVLWTKRSAEKPNVFSQKIKNLQPGRTYSLALLIGDYQDLLSGRSRKERFRVSIQIKNADMLPGTHNSFTSLRKSWVNKNFPKFPYSSPYWFNYCWRVFRARGTTAELIVSDWENPEKPGGNIGRELIYNFIEIQPFLEEK